MIFDEVIIGFGCFGMFFVVDYFGVILDLVIMVKGLILGVVFMGVVFCMFDIY